MTNMNQEGIAISYLYTSLLELSCRETCVVPSLKKLTMKPVVKFVVSSLSDDNPCNRRDCAVIEHLICVLVEKVSVILIHKMQPCKH